MLGKYVNNKTHITIPLFITYAFLPIPSNHIYITAALAKVHIRFLAVSFFLGRLISYSFWISVSALALKNLDTIFVNNFKNVGSLVVELAGFLLVYFIIKIDWDRLLKK